MKVFRCGKTARNWSITDEKGPGEYTDNWSPDKVIQLDGTIDKDGDRHTELGLQIDEEDIIALSNALITHYKEKIKSLEETLQFSESQLEEKRDRKNSLDNAIGKIHRLISIHHNKAPSPESLIETISEIARYYYYDATEQLNNPSIEWINWDEI
jgi:hypothetical protein